jgi:hypothetical protein
MHIAVRQAVKSPNSFLVPFQQKVCLSGRVETFFCVKSLRHTQHPSEADFACIVESLPLFYCITSIQEKLSANET